MERKGIVTAHGNPVTLVGPELRTGAEAPDFTVLDAAMQPVKLSSFKGKIVIISAVPSLDTPVCELQTIRFNQEAEKLNAAVLTISMDLPFAQARFCHSLNIEKIKVLSDFRDREFANSFGLYIRELGLIARSAFVIDRDGKVVYQQIVKEIGEQPDYDKVIDAAKKLGA